MAQELQYIPEATTTNMAQHILEIITFETFFMFSVIYFFIIWITLVLWTWMDIGKRSSNFFMRTISVLFVTLLGPLGLVIYLIIRPATLVNKKFLSEIEHNLAILSHMVESWKKWVILCPKCSHQVSHTSKICTKCKVNLEKKCHECDKTLLHGWKVCPYCSHKVSKKKKKK